jgi:hypothetical protein
MNVQQYSLGKGEHKLLIDGKFCPGNIMEGTKCRSCGKETVIYCGDWDAMLCWEENIWLENACDSPTCGYCAKRPVQPLPAILEDDEEGKASGWDPFAEDAMDNPNVELLDVGDDDEE